MRYNAFGSCIYCGSLEELTDEHIIPFGLNGNDVLPDSSCKKCAKATSRIERIIQRGELRPLRIFLNLKSRSKHKDADKLYPLKVVENGVEKIVNISIEDYPLMVAFPIFEQAQLISGVPTQGVINCIGIQSFNVGMDIIEFSKKYGYKKIKPSQEIRPVEFAIMLLKIGYCAGIASDLIKPKDVDPEIAEIIIGKRDNVGDFLGTQPCESAMRANGLHHLNCYQAGDGNLFVDIQLFSYLGTPVYRVFLNRKQ